MKTILIFLCVLIHGSFELEDLSCEQIRAFVDGHNMRRLKVAKGEVANQPAASEMKFMLWDDELAEKAAQWAAQNGQGHNPDKTIPSGRFTTGENLYWYSAMNSNQELNVDNALESWFDEHKMFKYNQIESSDFDGSKSYQIGHYTQMVWSETVLVGCAVSKTKEGDWDNFLVVCNYGPAGNFMGEYPYKTGSSSDLVCDCKKYDESCDCNKPYGKKCLQQ